MVRFRFLWGKRRDGTGELGSAGQLKNVPEIRLGEILERAGKRNAEEAVRLIVSVAEILENERETGRNGNLEIDGNLVRIRGGGRAIFIGDLHGDFNSLREILQKTEFVRRVQAENLYLVLMGDYMDRAMKPSASTL